MTAPVHRQWALRLNLVLASLGLAFLAWAFQIILVLLDDPVTSGNSLDLGRVAIPTLWFILGILLVASVLPTVLVWRRIRTAKKHDDRPQLTPNDVEDGRGDVVAYLVAVLVPLIFVNPTGDNSIVGPGLALVLVVLVFFSLDLYHVNPLWALFHWRVYSMHAPEACGACNHSVVVVTRDGPPIAGKTKRYLRITNHLYFEA